MKQVLSYLLFFFLLHSTQLIAQNLKVSGKVTDAQGAALPFATIYSTQASKGTTTNERGEYFLVLPKGEHALVFRFLGYQTITEKVELIDQNIVLNISLQEEVEQLGGVQISANGKDLAYEIIKNAMDKRKQYINTRKDFTCQAYVKNVQKITEFPDRLFGEKVDKTEVAIDTLDEEFIVYLSETISALYFQHPNKKEVVISSKVSGKPRAFSYNSARGLMVDFYQTNIELPISERKFISPIAPTAFLHYNFEFESVYKDGKQEVNIIKVIPKTKYSPLFSGKIHIQEDTWRIHQVDFYVDKSAGIDFIDTFRIRQTYVPMLNDEWQVGSVSYSFDWSFKLFGIKGAGLIHSVYSDYDFDAQFAPGFFGKEVMVVTDTSNRKSETYWEKIRPIPISTEEVKDYASRDSLFAYRESDVYKDSVDKISNEFKKTNLIFGYTYNISKKHFYVRFGSLLENFQFNTVEGPVVAVRFSVGQSLDERFRSWEFENKCRLGASSLRFYYTGKLTRQFNATNKQFIDFRFGHSIFQFNQQEPISPMLNTLYSMLLEENYARFFEKTFVNFHTGRELFNGFFLNATAQWEQRRTLNNADPLIDWYRDYENKVFQSNQPLVYDSATTYMPAVHQAFILGWQARVNFGQTFISRPYQKVNIESKYPTLLISYKKAIPISGVSHLNFDFLSLTVAKEISVGLVGNMDMSFEAAAFLNRRRVSFVDYAHFSTSEILVQKLTTASYRILPYYGYSTADPYVSAHFQHNLNGFITNKIPLIRKLGWQGVWGAHALLIQNRQPYVELHVGMEKIFKIVRLDFAWAFIEGHADAFALRMGLGF